ncbi:TPA: NnrS family protein [Neisseria meningitidis]
MPSCANCTITNSFANTTSALYYLLQLFAAAGYLWTGAAKLQNLPASAPLHLITLGGMMGGVMMVWLTAGLWHSGFTKLDYPKLCRIAVPILFAAAVFVLYLLTFVPIFRANAFTDDPE